jgi:hypothetical protein
VNGREVFTGSAMPKYETRFLTPIEMAEQLKMGMKTRKKMLYLLKNRLFFRGRYEELTNT